MENKFGWLSLGIHGEMLIRALNFVAILAKLLRPFTGRVSPENQVPNG